MLLARNLNLLLKHRSSQAPQFVKQLSVINFKRDIHSTCTLSIDRKDQTTENQNFENRIYYGTLSPQIRAVKVFSLTTSIIGIAAQPFLYEQAAKLGTSTPIIVGICGFIGFFTFITPFLIHIVASKYVTELHYNSKTDEYCATIISFFMIKKEVKFKRENIKVPEVPGMFTSFLVQSKDSKKEHALFVDPRLFDDTNHYIKLMGYDKPIDFKLNLSESDQEKLTKKKN